MYSSSKTAAKAERTPEYTNEKKIQEFLRHCYSVLLGRDADEEGLTHYTELILKGKNSSKQVAHDFMFSDEFCGRMSGNEELVRLQKDAPVPAQGKLFVWDFVLIAHAFLHSVMPKSMRIKRVPEDDST